MSAGLSARVLLVGAGGLGCPAAAVLVRSGVRHLTVVDDDRVEVSNLHRQTLYAEVDVGAPKAETACRALQAMVPIGQDTSGIVAREMRIRPDTALGLVKAHDLVVEGADNYATKFLVADACAISRVPVVHAGAVRWVGWALAAVPGAGACLRCVFEDIPRGVADTCATAGVAGPVVGVLGALQAALAVRVLTGDTDVAGHLHHYRALPGALRRARVQSNPECPLCAGEITDLRAERYAANARAAHESNALHQLRTRSLTAPQE